MSKLAKCRHLHVAIYGNEGDRAFALKSTQVHTVSAITMILSGRKSPHLLPSRFSRRVGPAYGSVLGPNGVKFKFARCLTNRPCWRNGITMRIMVSIWSSGRRRVR
ncbi:hypothetical protein OOU_Y34scaffold00248g1 [Pyricularia oryzae Y34]|uniref:Uncharacterized protein n=2 Tax=Pyricularia oryzae TaxID=318829 RepID=A0AA97P4L3_PYRO3|nr:hypothetical protein OOU_Y34scaffold00248g1 [Pyricularia oryzae Y34]